jgi:hypothetical protein
MRTVIIIKILPLP